MTSLPPIPDEAYDAISPMVGVHLSREVLEAAYPILASHLYGDLLRRISDSIGSSAGLSPDGSEDPVEAAFVDGVRMVWQIVRSLIEEVSRGSD